MSEYWVSRKKYYCRYCEIYIADDAPSRQQHENGLRHKGNKERFVRGLYKAGERKKKDLEEEKREMARVEQAAQAAFTLDVGAGHAKASTSTAGPSTAPRKPPPPKPTSAFANYSTAESLGYSDPDAERIKAEAERRRTQGLAGEWEVLQPLQTHSESPLPKDDSSIPQPGDREEKARKREIAVVADVDDDERQFKMRKKTANVGLGEIWDPGEIPIRLKTEVKTEDRSSTGGGDTIGESVGGASGAIAEGSNAAGAPKWIKREWKRVGMGEDTQEDGWATAASGEEQKVSLDEIQVHTSSNGMVPVRDKPREEQSIPVVTASITAAEEPSVKLEDASEPSVTSSQPEVNGGLFRKRKMPAGASVGSRGRRQF